MKALLERALAHPFTERFVLTVILINAITLGLETDARVMARFGDWLMVLDKAALAVFCVELAAKLYVRGLRFFRDPWNVFDFVVVAIALLPASGPLTVLRALRILRVLRLITIVPSLKRVVGALLGAMPGMASIVMLLLLIFYVGAVMSTKLFGEAFPEWFGSVADSFYTLFQVMTLESWSMGIVRPVMEVHDWAWAFFLPFILLTTFAVMNLVVGLIVNSMQAAHSAEEVAQTDAYREEVLARLRAIESRLDRQE
jgi:voltage-gated sodium channel